MRTFPVKKLIADRIEIGGKLLINENGDLYFDDELVATYEDLIGISMVSNETEMGFLRPKIGDIAKNTTTGEMFAWNGVWVPMYREGVKVFSVSNQSDLQFVNAIVGDIANITYENRTSIYLGNGDWYTILTGVVGNVDDNVISSYSTWSSEKIDYKIKNHDHDGGEY